MDPRRKCRRRQRQAIRRHSTWPRASGRCRGLEETIVCRCGCAQIAMRPRTGGAPREQALRTSRNPCGYRTTPTTPPGAAMAVPTAPLLPGGPAAVKCTRRRCHRCHRCRRCRRYHQPQCLPTSRLSINLPPPPPPPQPTCPRCWAKARTLGLLVPHGALQVPRSRPLSVFRRSLVLVGDGAAQRC
jgi:hypothetical protein